eukprot:TRINITY_DN50579_c0_g1_i1.p1 TRINITY_DN50579_c0_g1~~TRINITY_DN50579_c0_g1_i1.p1  ORF type:complete len:240 (-),score=37.00 TRINITY_DN50579_c0_g1_i1:366-1085(-)
METDHFKADVLLRELPDGAQVAVVTLLGSLCPITLGHVQGFHEARRILMGEAGVKRPMNLEVFGEVLGFISLNGDGHLSSKFKANGEEHMDYASRRELVRLATADEEWLSHEQYEGCMLQTVLPERYPGLIFTQFSLNGADDVAKYRKYGWASPKNRYITMGRPGYTQEVEEGMRDVGVDPEAGYFVLGPELPEISSTDARKALQRGDVAKLAGLLHPKVTEWCLDHGPYGGRGASSDS